MLPRQGHTLRNACFSGYSPLKAVRLLAGVGNCAQPQPPQGVVLLLPDLFGSFLFQFPASALELGWDPIERLFLRRLAVEAGEMWHREVQK